MFKTNMAEFLKETNKAIEKEQAKQHKKAKGIVLTAYSLILKGSKAVDTGLYKNSHLIEMGRKDTSILDPKNRQQRIKWSRTQDAIGVPTFDFKNNSSIRIYNNVKYAEYIEDGSSSRQDPFLYKRVEEKVRGML